MNQEQILLQQGMECIQKKDYEGAFSNFQQASQMGYAVAMNNLSVCYAKGYGTAVNRVEAFRWMKEASEKGYVESYYSLAQKYRLGDGTAVDLDKALFWTNLALQNSPEDRSQAQQLMQELTLLMTGNAPVPSALDQGVQHYNAGRYQEAFAIFQAEAEKGVPVAMNNLAVCYGNGQGTAPDPAAAFRWMKAAAEKGYTGSYYPLAVKYNSGNGTPVDNVQALAWARKAAQIAGGQQAQAKALVKKLESTSDEARFHQGVQAYRAGRYEEAFELFKEGAEKGFLGPMYNLAVCYQKGRGTAQDLETAFSLLTRAAKGGYIMAMNNLAVAYAKGEGTEPNPAAAFRWMKAAAENEYAPSYYPLACKYILGAGTPVDLEQATFWAQKGIACKDESVQKKCEQVMQHIRRQQKESAFQCPESAVADYQQGHQLFQEKRYSEAFPLLERAGRAGHPGALYDIGLAYHSGLGVPPTVSHAKRFFREAAYRGSQEAIRMLALGFDASVHSADLFQWQMYAQYHQLAGCKDVYDQGLRKRLQKLRAQSSGCELGPVSDSARDAMVSAMKCFVEHPTVMLKNVYHKQGLADASYYLLNAASYGNVDGVCGYVYYLDAINSKGEYTQTRNEYLRLAAYMGHSYAMYRVAKLYEGSEPDVAKQCYYTAAKWGYGPAITWCAQNDVTMD